MNVRSTSRQAENGNEQHGGVGVTSEDKQNLDALERRQLDSDDLNKELAGKQFSRRVRFLTSDDDESNPRERRKGRNFERQAHMSALAQMMADPAYRALYDETLAKLRQAQMMAEAAKEAADEFLQKTQNGMQDLRDNANRLEDGTRVYVDADGNVRRENGTIVDHADLDGVALNPSAPSYEDYLAQAAVLNSAHADVETVAGHQSDLAEADAQLHDPNNPLSPEELEALQDNFESESVPLIQPDKEITAAADATHQHPSEIQVPQLG